MLKLLYLTVWDFKEAEANGICKKILSQVRTLENMGFDVDFAYTKNGEAHIKHDGEDKFLGKTPVALNIMLAHCIFAKYLKNKKYDAIYIRHCVANPFYIRLLSILKKSCSKLVVEIPTYPYDAELKGDWKLVAGKYMDKFSRKKMKRYVDRIVTYSKDDSIFGVPTIKTINGVDFSAIPQAIKKVEGKEINFIAVAMLAPWHGYDRVIAGLNNYYQKPRKDIVKFHVVGNGSELEKYKKMVHEWKLDSYVEFYGNKTGRELDNIYNKADVAVSSLGLHRIGLSSASPLKTREYGARGLMMIAEHAMDFLPSECPYIFVTSADEAPLNIEEVVHFYREIEKGEDIKTVRNYMREITRNVADMPATFEPIKNYFMEE